MHGRLGSSPRASCASLHDHSLGARTTKEVQVRIASVESFLLGDMHLVRIREENGLAGLGQSACWAYPEAVDAVVHAFRPHLQGADPFRVEHHWQYLYRMGPFRGSILGGAISAVDLALWDLKGKALGVPVWELLGGRYRDRIRLHRIIGGAGTEELVANARSAVADGFTALKFMPLPPDYADRALPGMIEAMEERVEAVRSTAGLEVDLILELHRSLTPLQALSVVDALRPFRPLFVEDAIQIDSIQSQGELARRFTVPFGNGERMHTIWEFRELLERGGPQYVRADPGLAGGLTHCKKIAAIAEAHGAAVVTHNWIGPVLTAACVQLDTCIPNFVVQEYVPEVDEGPVGAPFRSTLIRDGGYLEVPDAPGLGVELDEAWEGGIRILSRALTDIPLRLDGSVAFAV